MTSPLLLLLAAALPAQDAAPLPPFKFLRADEDWSDYHPTEEDGLLARLKHLDLSADGSVWVSFGARAEARLESWNNFAFGAPSGSDDEFILSRAFVHGDLHLGDAVRLFVEGKTAQSTSRDLPGGRRPLDMDTVDLQQAFLDVSLPLAGGRLTLRPGRQMFSFGAQRLISPLPWGNTLRTWDGVTARWVGDGWAVHGLATAFAPVDKTEFNSVDRDTTLYGLYATRAPKDGGRGLDLYLIGNERSQVTVNGTSGDERRTTAGFRSWGPLEGPWDLEVEAAHQSGKVGDGDVSAWMLAAELGNRQVVLPGASRSWLGLDLASGDSSPGGDVGTFHQLFPLGHAYLGYADFVGRQNIFDLSAGSTWPVAEGVTLDLDLHHFRVLDTDDALYAASGAPIRTGLTHKNVGSEVDVLANWAIQRGVKSYAGYSHFFAGSALESSGPGKDVDFVYLGLSYTL